MLKKIDESIIERKTKHFIGHQELMKELIGISDIIFDERDEISDEIIELLDIKGNILLSGIPGTGKTTIAYLLAKHVMDKYGIESYEISISNLIETALGKSTSNMGKVIDELNEISRSYGALLILDEIDRFFINRKNENEISELKRMLIEFMDYIDRITLKDKIIIIGITNIIDSLDTALLRRFEFNRKIETSPVILEHLIIYINKEIGIEMDTDLIKQYSELADNGCVTCDTVKKVYKNVVIGNYNNKNEICTRIIDELSREVKKCQ